MNNPIERIIQFVARRRATRQLTDAILAGDLDAMRQALANGAQPDRVRHDFEEPMRHFQEFYEVRGALELAVHQRMRLEAFEILLEAGARPRQTPLCQGEVRHWSLAPQIEGLCQTIPERVRMENNTRTATGRGERVARL